MIRAIIIFVLTCMAAINCSSQSFLDKYPKLTKKNLSDFFKDWKTYSDSISEHYECSTEICDVVNSELNSVPRALRGLQGCTVTSTVTNFNVNGYSIIPQNIVVEYYPICPTPNDTLFFAHDYCSMYKEILAKDTITPKLLPNELYSTKAISTHLMKFLTGEDVESHRPTKFIKKNITALSKYLYHYNGEYYGWVDFNDYPYIWKVQATDDFIVLHIINGHYTGYEQWYIKKDDNFQKVEGRRNWWTE